MEETPTTPTTPEPEATTELHNAEAALETESTEPVATVRPEIKVESPMRMPFKAGAKEPHPLNCLCLMAKDKELIKDLEVPNLDYTMDEAGETWVKVIAEAGKNMSDISFRKTAARHGADWTQRPEFEGETIIPGRPRVLAGKSGERISGERAIMRMTSLMGLGDRIDIPLWHSGIWVTIRTPSDGALLELDKIIALDKVTLGRSSNGTVFSHSSVYMANHIMNLFEDCLYSHRVRDKSPGELRSLIKATDLPLICWGLLCAIYPGGYPYAHPCLTDVDKCQHVSTALINIAKTLWVDNDKLTAYQREFMVSRNKPRNVDEIIKYQEDGTVIASKEVKLNDDIAIWLKVPTIEGYIESGYAWVEGIISMTDGAFSTKIRGNERDTYISNQALLSSMNQYCHWVDKMVITDGEVLEDVPTIREVLRVMSSDETLRTDFLNAVGDYIEDASVAIIAIDNFECPNCGSMESVDGVNKYLIPLDVMQTFFTLLRRKVS